MTLRVALSFLSGGCALALLLAAQASQPRIFLIERYLTSQVLVHFDTDANRTYTLQYTTSLTPTGNWSNLFVAPAFPFADHYIVVDSMTNRSRFYRLSVKP